MSLFKRKKDQSTPTPTAEEGLSDVAASGQESNAANDMPMADETPPTATSDPQAIEQDASQRLQNLEEAAQFFRQRFVAAAQALAAAGAALNASLAQEARAICEKQINNAGEAKQSLAELYQQGREAAQNYQKIFAHFPALVARMQAAYAELGEAEAQLAKAGSSGRELKMLYEGFGITVLSLQNCEQAKDDEAGAAFAEARYVPAFAPKPVAFAFEAESALAALPCGRLAGDLRERWQKALDEFKQRRQRLEEEVSRWQRNEQLNLRKQVNAVQLAFSKFFKDHFGFVLENLDGSRRHLTENSKLKENLQNARATGTIDPAWLDKLENIYDRFKAIIQDYFQNLGVVLIEPKPGEEMFQPGLHHALGKDYHPTYEANKVLRSAGFGLRLANRDGLEGVIYPAKVFVSMGPKPAAREEPAEAAAVEK